MAEQVVGNIIDEYSNKFDCYKRFNKKLNDLVSTLIRNSDIRIHSINGRIKTKKSIELKIIESNYRYRKLTDITDISGLRIITYFGDDVDKVAKIIKEEFDVDEENSVDKRKLLDPDRFGYLSLHYVVRLTQSRTKLPEYNEFKNMKTEIQIRSILQHAWAELEHDLGYKSKTTLPRDIQRKFSRVAGLLEIGDDEFITIRNFLEGYSERVADDIKQKPGTVLIDKISLVAFVKENDLIQELDQEIALIWKRKLIFSEGSIGNSIRNLRFANIRDIDDLLREIRENKNAIIKFARKWIEPEKIKFSRKICSGVSFFYLVYVILCKEENALVRIIEYLMEVDIEPYEGDRAQLAKKILETYKEIAIME